MHISCLSLLIESTNRFYKTPTGFDNGKDIFEVKFTKEIDRQLSARPPTGEELNPDKSK